MTSLSIAIKIVKKTYGCTNEFLFKTLKWIPIETRYQLNIQKLTHKLLNRDNKNRHFLATLLTANRNTRNLSQNKCGPKNRVEKDDKYSLKNFKNKATDIYNKVPKYLTLLKNPNKFRKCLTKLTIYPPTFFKIQDQNDYNENNLIDFKNIIGQDCNDFMGNGPVSSA